MDSRAAALDLVVTAHPSMMASFLDHVILSSLELESRVVLGLAGWIWSCARLPPEETLDPHISR
jgi:hypothetical protein